MSNDSNPSAFGESKGCGNVLRDAREAQGLSIEEAAGRLHMPVHVVRALEQEDWQRLGAPVFVRGQVRSYARLLGVDLSPLLAQAHVAPVEPVKLVSHSHIPRAKWMFDNIMRRAVYVVITAVLVVPIWYAAHYHFGAEALRTAALDVMPGSREAAVPAPPASTPEEARVPAETPRKVNPPYVASLTPVRPAVAEPSGLKLEFSGDSWVQVTGQDGQVVEKALVKAGEERQYTAGQVGRVVLGNASAVEVQHDGSTVDLTPFRRANVARFAVSSDGSVVPASN
ncbi:helix-turn-helix domain-containing protein [Xanthomonas massiliensis]|uniref:helix-turn-helix domain-containing protein n=1 Tax=Xanthomonas massiliensis TaxID=1720302 RepID=UPI0008261207|nr:RodZ domain-containing protein [Xanthomonas massiliensis]